METFVITGAGGFIGSHICRALSCPPLCRVVAVDRDAVIASGRWVPMVRDLFVPHDRLFDWLEGLMPDCGDPVKDVAAVVHMGACSDTTNDDAEFMVANNCTYSKLLWNWCADRGKTFIYASSAATYGDGRHGFDDEHPRPEDFEPLNLYAQTKHSFDLWALSQDARGAAPPSWAGLKFFNVYGTGERFKGRMASMVHQARRQAVETGTVRLFKSDRPGVPDGGQKRDFVHVSDVVSVVKHFLRPGRPSGLFNVGTGQARSFLELAHAVFRSVGRAPRIEFVPMPDSLRPRYQHFTEARTEKLRRSGYSAPFLPLEEGVEKFCRDAATDRLEDPSFPEGT